MILLIYKKICPLNLRPKAAYSIADLSDTSKPDIAPKKIIKAAVIEAFAGVNM